MNLVYRNRAGSDMSQIPAVTSESEGLFRYLYKWTQPMFSNHAHLFVSKSILVALCDFVLTMGIRTLPILPRSCIYPQKITKFARNGVAGVGSVPTKKYQYDGGRERCRNGMGVKKRRKWKRGGREMGRIKTRKGTRQQTRGTGKRAASGVYRRQGGNRTGDIRGADGGNGESTQKKLYRREREGETERERP